MFSGNHDPFFLAFTESPVTTITAILILLALWLTLRPDRRL